MEYWKVSRWKSNHYLTWRRYHQQYSSSTAAPLHVGMGTFLEKYWRWCEDCTTVGISAAWAVLRCVHRWFTCFPLLCGLVRWLCFYPSWARLGLEQKASAWYYNRSFKWRLLAGHRSVFVGLHGAAFFSHKIASRLLISSTVQVIKLRDTIVGIIVYDRKPNKVIHTNYTSCLCGCTFCGIWSEELRLLDKQY